MKNVRKEEKEEIIKTKWNKTKERKEARKIAKRTK